MSLPQIREYGYIKEIKKSIASIGGLSSYMSGQVFDVGLRTRAMVMGFDKEEVSVLFLGRAEDVKVGDIVYNNPNDFKIPVGEGFKGRVVNALAEPMDGHGKITGKLLQYPVFAEAPGVLERVPLLDAFETGNLIIDASIPIGKGQRELIVGDKMIGKTSLCLDAIIHQKSKGVVCIYCCIGRTQASLEKVIELLQARGVMDNTIIVSATAYSAAGEQYLAPYTACTLGEYFMKNGQDVFVVFDDLTRHAWAYRQISLLLERSPGRDAYPGDIFYLHSQLMERAGKLSPEYQGGSMTFFPIVEALGGDITSYVPSNLVSMTDGQIYLNTALFSAGFKPAIDLGLSVSRIGNKIQSPAMRQLSSTLRLEYIQYLELLKITQLKSEVSPEINQRLKHGASMTRLFIQDKGVPRSLIEELIFLYTLKLDILAPLSNPQIEYFKNHIMPFAQEKYPLLIEELNRDKKITPPVTESLNACLAAFFKKRSL